jgi:hypothetical protein
MTEQQIRDGFERLDLALAPPLDAPDRVARRVTVRRRRRRANIAGAAVLVVAAGTAFALGGDDDQSGDRLAVDQPAPASTLVMTRHDGSTYAFQDVTVSCRPPVTGASLGPVARRIWLTSPMVLTGDAEDVDTRAQQPFVYVEGIVADLQGDRTFDLPLESDGDSSTYPLTLFIADSEGNAERGNEVSSSEGGAAGTVRVLEASCDPVPVLRIEVDATLGSEVNQGTIDLAGSAG